jgi:non-specific protein-tyrosine kinase
MDKKGPVPLVEETSPGRTRAESIGWVSPVYSRSRTVTVNTRLAVENRCVCLSSHTEEIEYYKILRTQILQRTRDRGWNTVMVTSPLPGEGKTVTAINLAVTFAKEFNHTVLLVDGDLKQQKVHTLLGFKSSRGLINYLLENRPLAELIVWPGIEKLTLMSGGRTIKDTSELLGSPRMKALVTEMKDRYKDRYIFFDVPPILSGADAIAFAPFVDSILLVVEVDRTSMEDIHKALDLMPKDKFLGFVLNRKKFPTKNHDKTAQEMTDYVRKFLRVQKKAL